VALELSEIFAWDIDFTTDIRNGDTYRAVVEDLWHDGKFVRHGRIMAAEFTNNGTTYEAYRFEENGRAGYYDAKGKSLRRAFLKAPLNYKRISSGYGIRRHPITKRVEMHRGIDYAAPLGTPVSAVGDGIVEYAGYKGLNGNIIIIRHPNGYRTYYLHLHKILKAVRRGRRVVQGQEIGTVGATGRATGPHLDFRIKKGRNFVNPLKIHIPKAAGVTRALRAEFNTLRVHMNAKLSATPVDGSVHVASAGTKE
jgi:murein DD-endopeptidase MepM/ murein hydrolase activator NlpD